MLIAALIWSVVGFFLMVNGFLLVDMAGRGWLAFPSLAVGTVKGLLIMDRVARKNIDRIAQMTDGACIGSVYSYKSWGLVVLMIVTGRVLRTLVLPGEVIGVVYLAVGWALFWASRLMWRRWWNWPGLSL